MDLDKTFELMQGENDSIKSGKKYLNIFLIFLCELQIYLLFLFCTYYIITTTIYLIVELFFLIAKFLKDSQFKNAFEVRY